jgi:hypothetical protein
MGKTQNVHKTFVGNIADNRNFEGHSGNWQGGRKKFITERNGRSS